MQHHTHLFQLGQTPVGLVRTPRRTTVPNKRERYARTTSRI
jgi:hypothetical protein